MLGTVCLPPTLLSAALGICLFCGCQAKAIDVLKEPSGPTQAATREPTDAAAAALDTSELVVDDFDDLDVYPLSTAFGAWHTYTYNAGPQLVELSVDATGSADGGALRLDFEINDPVNGAPDYGLAGLDTQARAGSSDLSGFSGIRLSHRLESRLPACKLPREIRFGVYCADQIANFEIPLGLTPMWLTDDVDFSFFREITYRPPTGIPVSECLASVTALYFEVTPELDDGGCGAASVWLDSIVLR